MPPPKAPQPTDDERKLLVAWLDHTVNIDCSQLTDEQRRRYYRTYVMSRRLTRVEYDNSIRDLVGLELQPSSLLPSDGAGGEGFDTNGSTLFLSPILMEKYLEAATMCVDTLLPDAHDAFPPHLTLARQQLLIAKPSDQLSAREAARQIVAAFARRAFRRAVTAAEVERLIALFDHAQQQGDSFEAALRQPLKAVLVSPNFLFLVEQHPEQGGFYRIGQFELATRLAYFIWAAPPDDALLSVAESGRLHEEGVLREETQRLLKDPKSGGLAHNFSRQWLGLDALGTTVKPDPQRFPEFDQELTMAMRDEADMLFEYVLREDRSLLELIDADYTFVNRNSPGIMAWSESAAARCAASPLTDRNRGGVLTQAGVLTITSYPLRTSPVLRGRWVLEQILGGKVPPPPPNVPQLARTEAHPGSDHSAATARGPSGRRRLCHLPQSDGSARIRPGEFWPDRPLADQVPRRGRYGIRSRWPGRRCLGHAPLGRQVRRPGRAQSVDPGSQGRVSAAFRPQDVRLCPGPGAEQSRRLCGGRHAQSSGRKPVSLVRACRPGRAKLPVSAPFSRQAVTALKLAHSGGAGRKYCQPRVSQPDGREILRNSLFAPRGPVGIQ